MAESLYVSYQKKPRYSGHGYSGLLVIVDAFFRQFGQLYLPIADTKKIKYRYVTKSTPIHIPAPFANTPTPPHTIPTAPNPHICTQMQIWKYEMIFLYFIHFSRRLSSSFSILSILLKSYLTALMFREICTRLELPNPVQVHGLHVFQLLDIEFYTQEAREIWEIPHCNSGRHVLLYGDLSCCHGEQLCCFHRDHFHIHVCNLIIPLVFTCSRSGAYLWLQWIIL